MNNKQNMFDQCRTNAHRTDRCNLFYDWFCKEEQLPKRAERLMKLAKKVILSPKFDATKCYVFLKNNCPLDGPLYDDFRICDLETGDVLYNFTPKSGHSGKAEVWGRYENNFLVPLIIGTVTDCIKFLMEED